jgi:selenium-binding protein 1
MTQTVDPTFYRSPAEAIAAPRERLAYVAAYDRAGQAKDALAVLDVEESSDSYGRVVGWSELPTAGNELHHFGWNACSSALCHQGHGGPGGAALLDHDSFEVIGPGRPTGATSGSATTAGGTCTTTP